MVTEKTAKQLAADKYLNRLWQLKGNKCAITSIISSLDDLILEKNLLRELNNVYNNILQALKEEATEAGVKVDIRKRKSKNG